VGSVSDSRFPIIGFNEIKDVEDDLVIYVGDLEVINVPTDGALPAIYELVSNTGIRTL
jgi:hypothetical protein